MPRFQVYACVTSFILIIWAVGTFLLPPAAGGRIGEDFSSIPKKIAGWEGRDGMFEATVYEQLSTCSLLSRDYTDEEGNVVNLSIVYGRHLGDFHQPERCMQGSGMRPTSSKVIWLHPKGMEPHKATMITMSDNLHDLVMVYWFYMGGKLSPTMGTSKSRAVMNAMLGRKVEPSVMVKFLADANWDEDMAQKSATNLAELLEPHIIQMAQKPPKYEPSEAILERMSE